MSLINYVMHIGGGRRAFFTLLHNMQVNKVNKRNEGGRWVKNLTKERYVIYGWPLTIYFFKLVKISFSG